MADLKFLRLWDIYSPLLTPTQRDIGDLFFNLDLTISEIAEQKGISRQGVSESLSQTKKPLNEYRQKRGVLRIGRGESLKCALAASRAESFLQKQSQAHPEMKSCFDELEAILKKDYSAEAEALINNSDKE